MALTISRQLFLKRGVQFFSLEMSLQWCYQGVWSPENGHSCMFWEKEKGEESVILLIKGKISPMTPVSQSNVSTMAAEYRVFGSPTLPQRKSVPLAVHPLKEKCSTLLKYLVFCPQLKFGKDIFHSLWRLTQATKLTFRGGEVKVHVVTNIRCVCSNMLSVNSYYLCKSTPSWVAQILSWHFHFPFTKAQ